MQGRRRLRRKSRPIYRYREKSEEIYAAELRMENDEQILVGGGSRITTRR